MNCRSDVAVTEPFLYLLHRYAVGEHQRRAGVAQVVKTYLPQPVLFQKPPERFGDPVRFKKFSHFVHENVSVVFIVVAVAADALVHRLLLFQCHEPFLELTDERHGAQTGFRFRFVRLNEDLFAVELCARYGVPYRDRSAFEVYGVPPEPDDLLATEAVERGHLDQQSELVCFRLFKKLGEFLVVIIRRDILCLFRALHLVHRAEVQEIEHDRMLKRAVDHDVLLDDHRLRPPFHFFNVEHLNIDRLDAAERLFLFPEIRTDIVLDEIGIVRVGRERDAPFLHLEPYIEIIGEKHIQGKIAVTALNFRNNEIAAYLDELFLRRSFISPDGEIRRDPRLMPLSDVVSVGEYGVIIAVLFL